MENKYGIETIKNDITIVAKVINKVDEALEDGKINWVTEGLPLAMYVPKLFKAAKNWKEAKVEIKDLTEDEMTDINAHIAIVFDIRNDEAEMLVERIIQVILSIAAAFLIKEAA